MATLEKIRNRAGVLVAIVIGFALIAFILGDLLNSGGGSFLSNKQFEIAEIAGTSIPYQEYQAKVDYMTEINQLLTGRSSTDDVARERLMESTWQQMIQEYVLSDEYKELGIAVSAEELKDMIDGINPHPIIQQVFADPQTGQVNKAQITNFIKNLDQDPSGNARKWWMYIENEIVRETSFRKYNNLIAKGLYVTENQAGNSNIEKGRKVNVEYIVKRYTTISDSLVSYTNGDIQKYYNENKNDFKQEKSRDIAYVTFDVKPSESDFKDAEKWINDTKNEFAGVSDAIQYLNVNSDEQYVAKNYKASEVEERLQDFVKTSKVGDIYGPYFEDNKYKVTKLHKIVNVPDSVKVRHILIQPEAQTQQAYDNAKSLADSLEGIVNKSNFTRLALQYSKDQATAGNGGEIGWIPDAGASPFNDACFNGKKGEIVLVETQYGFHIINIQNKAKEVKKYQLATVVRNVVPSSNTYQQYYAEASKFAGLNPSYEEFNNAVQEQKLSKRYANKLNENQKKIAGLESPRTVVKWAFEADVNKVSDVFDLGESYVVAVLIASRDEGIAPLESVKNEIALNVRKQKKAEIIRNEFSGADFDGIAQKSNLKVEEANNITFNSYAFAGAGIEPKIVAVAANGEANKVYGPIEGNNGVFMIRISEVAEEAGKDLTLAKSQLKNNFKTREQYEAFEALREIAEIKDSRAKFY